MAKGNIQKQSTDSGDISVYAQESNSPCGNLQGWIWPFAALLPISAHANADTFTQNLHTDAKADFH
jgi:hypothetical protein